MNGILRQLLRRQCITAAVRQLPARLYTNRNVIQLCEQRGLLQTCLPDALGNDFFNFLREKPRCVYAGFDPTAPSLHVGNLLILVSLLHWQRAGHNVIALLGGATASIGDPSGKAHERDLVAHDTINNNAKSIEASVRQIFENHLQYFWNDADKEPLPPVRIVNNKDWYERIPVVDFIRNTGRSIRVGTMLTRELVQRRLQDQTEGMNFAEFSYLLFQAYDWQYLLEKYDCTIQIGGSDQISNINAGRQLIHKKLDRDVYGFTVPLQKSETGDKHGKTAGNAVWLNDDKTSAFELYQFFMQRRDDEVEQFLRQLTFKPLKEIEDLMAKQRREPEKRHAQKCLAQQLTLLVHGEEGLKRAIQTTKALYEGTLQSLAVLSQEDLKTIFKSAPSVNLLLHPGTTITDLAVKAGCFKSISDAHKVISAGGFYVNHERRSNTEEVVVPGIHILPNNLSLVRVGKKNYYVVQWKM